MNHDTEVSVDNELTVVGPQKITANGSSSQLTMGVF